MGNLYTNRQYLNDDQKLEWIHFAIQEALNGNLGELKQALELVEDLRENPLTDLL